MTPVGVEPHSRPTSDTRLDAHQVLAEWGPHPVQRLKLSFEEPDDETLGRWLVACCLLAQRCPAARVAEVCGELERVGQGHPEKIRCGDAPTLATTLATSEVIEKGAGMPLPLSEWSGKHAPPGPLKWQVMLESLELRPRR